MRFGAGLVLAIILLCAAPAQAERADLYGPVPDEATALHVVPGPVWSFVGSAASASATPFDADLIEPIARARFCLIWTPGPASNRVRLVSWWTGMAEIARVQSDGSLTPRAQCWYITEALEALRQSLAARGGMTFLAYQVAGEWAGPMTLYAVWVDWR